MQLNTHRFRTTNHVGMLFLESTAQKYGTCITCELGKCNLFLEPVCIYAESRFAHRASPHVTSLKSASARLLAFKHGSHKVLSPANFTSVSQELIRMAKKLRKGAIRKEETN